MTIVYSIYMYLPSQLNTDYRNMQMNSPYTHRQYTYLFNSHYILSNVNNTSRIIEADQLRDGQNPLTRISKMICKFSSLTQYGKQMFHLCRTHILWLRVSGRWRLRGCRIHTVRLSPRQNRNPEHSGASDWFILVQNLCLYCHTNLISSKWMHH